MLASETNSCSSWRSRDWTSEPDYHISILECVACITKNGRRGPLRGQTVGRAAAGARRTILVGTMANDRDPRRFLYMLRSRFGAPLTFNASMPVRCPRRDRPDARFRQRAGSSFPERRCGPHVGWHARMHHRRRMAPERLRAAAAHCQLEDLQRIEEVERLGLTALDADRKCGPCARALPEIGGSFLSVGDRRQHLRHGEMLAQELRDSPRVWIGLFHPERQHLERPAQHPARVRFQLRADAAAQRQDPRLAQLAKLCQLGCATSTGASTVQTADFKGD